MITATNVEIARGNRILFDGISLECSAGHVHAIVGANGSGKSSLLSALSGDLPTRAGQIHLMGRDLADLSDIEQARSRAVLSQHFPLFPFTVYQLLSLAEKQQTSLGNLKPEVEIDLSDLLNRKFTTLSGGERAKVMMALTLAQGAKVLLLDEPTASLDRSNRDRFVDWLDQWSTLGYAVVVVTHDEKIEALASSVTSL